MLTLFKIGRILLCTFVVLLNSFSVTADTKSDSKTFSKQKHYRHIMFRETPYASYRGIHPISDSCPKQMRIINLAMMRKGA